MDVRCIPSWTSSSRRLRELAIPPLTIQTDRPARTNPVNTLWNPHSIGPRVPSAGFSDRRGENSPDVTDHRPRQDAAARAGPQPPARSARTPQASPGRGVRRERSTTVGGPAGASLPCTAAQRGVRAALDSPLTAPVHPGAEGVRVALGRDQLRRPTAGRLDPDGAGRHLRLVALEQSLRLPARLPGAEAGRPSRCRGVRARPRAGDGHPAGRAGAPATAGGDARGVPS
jgi:hypothetical protein